MRRALKGGSKFKRTKRWKPSDGAQPGAVSENEIELKGSERCGTIKRELSTIR